MPSVRFTKAVASGNDFIILDNTGGVLGAAGINFAGFALKMCRRKVSIGADGVLVLEDSPRGDLRMRIFNPDGSEVTMCGNGARCAAAYARLKGRCQGDIRMETGAGIVEAAMNGGLVRLKMTDPKDMKLDKNLGIDNHVLMAHYVNTGVPHVVFFVENIEEYPVRDIGSKIRYHSAFSPDGTNANFVKITGPDTIRVRTYERGVEDETLACGTGSVASAIISSVVHGLKSPVKALTSSGETLNVYFEPRGGRVSNVCLEGRAEISYEGEVQYV
ncbi:MAG: diaminopimelate epimerase [Candidatus Omnitrophota bacterium]